MSLKGEYYQMYTRQQQSLELQASLDALKLLEERAKAAELERRKAGMKAHDCIAYVAFQHLICCPMTAA